MKKKICTKCKIEKTYDNFHKSKHSLGGVRSICKECRKFEKIEYNQRDYVIEKKRDYYQKHKEEIRERLTTYYWSLTSQYHEYKKRAKKKKMDFEISKEDSKLFYNTNCYYCGDDFKGMGIDRIDNNKGYVLNNVVPCCSRCNFMKHVLNREEFFTHIKKILNNVQQFQ